MQTILWLVVLLLGGTKEQPKAKPEFVGYLNGNRIEWKTQEATLDQVLNAYEASDDKTLGEFVARLLQTEETVEAFTYEAWSSGEREFAFTAGKETGIGYVLGNDLVIEINTLDGTLDTFSFNVVGPAPGFEGFIQQPIRLLRPPVCRCPRDGGHCTSQQCEDGKTCTGTDGTTGSCELAAQVV